MTENSEAVLLDLDCLLVQSNIYNSIEEKESSKFLQYSPKEKICNLVRSLSEFYTIIIISLRTNNYKHVYNTWLKNNKIYCILFCKDIDDIRYFVDYKQSIYNEYIKQNYDVILSIEHNQELVNLWKSYHILTIHTDIDDDQ